jgi:hypothetical protein
MFIMFQIREPPWHNVEYEESSGLRDENYLPLCFSSFEWLKANHERTKETGKSDYIHSDTVLHKEIVIIKEDQQHSHALDDHVADYLEGYSNSELQSVLNHQIKKEE